MEMIDQNEILRRIGHYTYLKNLGIKQISDEEYDLIDEARDLTFHLRLNDFNDIAVSIELDMSKVVRFTSLDAYDLIKIASFEIEDNKLKIYAYRFKPSDEAFKLIDHLTEFCEELKMKRKGD